MRDSQPNDLDPSPILSSLQADLDGDFLLDDLPHLPDAPSRTRRISVADALAFQAWNLDPESPVRGMNYADLVLLPDQPADMSQIATHDDNVLLQRFETAGLLYPPVSKRVCSLSTLVATSWLALSKHWIELSQATGDLRFLNAACKLTGAVWTQRRRLYHQVEVLFQLDSVARLLKRVTDELRANLNRRVLLPALINSGDSALLLPQLNGASSVRTIILGGVGSRSVGRLIAAAASVRLDIAAVCWFESSTHDALIDHQSSYARPWYPPVGRFTSESPTPALPAGLRTITAQNWKSAVDAIRSLNADLVLLVGMPIVPPAVLSAAKIGVLNAHNGLLPSHRGMDAVGWALLHNQPIVCSLHLARPAVDTGEVIATSPVQPAPASTLAARVKASQLKLLISGAAHIAAHGSLPDLTPQHPSGTLLYRLHPHLKRLLDESPYSRDPDPGRMICVD